eukprot:scaffold288862_cov50-Tisochrysis_lutea.AAC.1
MYDVARCLNEASSGRWSEAAFPVNRSGLGPNLCHWILSENLLWYSLSILVWMVCDRRVNPVPTPRARAGV